MEKQKEKEGLNLSLSLGDLKMQVSSDDQLDEKFFQALDRFYDLAQQSSDQQHVRIQKRIQEMQRDSCVENAIAWGLATFFVAMLALPWVLLLKRPAPVKQSFVEVLTKC